MIGLDGGRHWLFGVDGVLVAGVDVAGMGCISILEGFGRICSGALEIALGVFFHGLADGGPFCRRRRWWRGCVFNGCGWCGCWDVGVGAVLGGVLCFDPVADALYGVPIDLFFCFGDSG